MDILRRCKGILSGVSDFPESEARIVLEEVFGKSPFLFREKIRDEEIEKLEKLLLLRVGERIPIPYITGKVHFFDLEFKIRERVFIPRPETEIMIETLMDKIESNRDFLFLDIGTGCGNIAITVLKHFKNSKGVAIDISEEALFIARENATRHRVLNRLYFVVGDGANCPLQLEKFDIILSNPPYIPTNAIEGLSPEVKKEPRIAIDGGVDGLHYVRKFLLEGFKVLKKGGLFLMEIGPETYKGALEFASLHFENEELKRDLCGTPRLLILTK